MSNLKFIFPCKKLRRSQRLEIKEITEIKTRTINNGQLGLFEILPLELKFTVFSYLQVEELSLLTISSKSMRNMIELYRHTSYSQKFLLPKPITHRVIPVSEQAYYTRQFRRLGLLMKRSTCLYATKDRLRLIQQFLQKYLCNFHKSCDAPSQCIALVCYGKFLQTVIAGWDDKECTKVFETIGNNTLMIRHLDNIVKYKLGAYPSLELHVRLFFRRVFINQALNNQDHAFWLSLILKPFPMVHQARILFLLFGPMCGDEIQWHEMCESTPLSKDQAIMCFSDMANAFKTLHHHSKEWSEDDIISVLDEVTSAPDEWLSENVASLLYLCGDCITLKVLNSKAINGRITELASIIMSLCMVCVRHSHSVTWVINIMNGVCSVIDNARDKVALLHGVIDMFKEVIMDQHEYGEAADDSGNELEVMMEAQAAFCKELICMAFRTVIYS